MSYSNSKTTTHDEMYPLLPWLVNGTLSSTQRDQVMGHVSKCDFCQEEMRLLKLLNNDLASSSQSIYESKADLEGNLTSVMQRIETEQKSEAGASSLIDKWWFSLEQMSGTISDYLKRQWVAPALVASLLFVTIGSWSLYEQQQGDYSVLSSSDKPASMAQISVQFETGTQSADAMALIRKQIMGFDSEIVVERSESGDYLVEFEEAVELGQLNELVGKLQAIENVSSAELR